jgi:SAM-dependent methyltransferase
VALLGCYAPLSDHGWIGGLDAATGKDLAALIAQQVTAPSRESKLEKEIETLSPVREATSLKVQALYEESPYPRWVVPLRKDVLPTREVYARKYPGADLAALEDRETPDILVAGCGTGLNILSAITGYKSWALTGIDISRRSLAHAMRHVRDLGLPNIRLIQADILDLSALEGTFDIIESIGVLHHLADPLKGWRILTEKLRPGGVMQVALYSALSRRGVEAVRRYAAAHGFRSTRDDVLAFRHHVMNILRDPRHPNFALLQESTVLDSHEFYAVSTCRDLLFHPQETLFTLPEIKRMIAALGLDFVGFSFSTPAHLASYRVRFPDDPFGTDLDNWDQVERENPSMFARMYVLTLQKPAHGEGTVR